LLGMSKARTADRGACFSDSGPMIQIGIWRSLTIWNDPSIEIW
jgi:hypothetical protein